MKHLHACSPTVFFVLVGRLHVWVKNPRVDHGQRFRQDHENMLIAWKGPGESNIVRHIDPRDQSRYSTVHRQGKVSNLFKFNGRILNAYQKPINLIKKQLLMFTSPGDLILDVTCGSGTTAVSLPLYFRPDRGTTLTHSRFRYSSTPLL